MVSRFRELWVGVALVVGCGDDASATDEGAAESGAQSTGAVTTELPTTGVVSGAGGTTGDDGASAGSTGEDATGAASTSGEASAGSTGEDETGGSEEESAGESEDGPVCPLAQMHLPCDADSDAPLHAIGLDCSALGLPWIDRQTATAAQKFELMAAPEQGGRRPWQVARAYGSYVDPDTQKPFWSAREGEKVLLLSSGLLPAPDGEGVVLIAGAEVYNDVGDGVWDADVMPPPMSPTHGSPDPDGFKDCDGVGDCSNTLATQWALGGGDPNDRLWLRFEVTAPSLDAGDIADAHGYSFDFAFFSAEFPEWVDTPYNDIFVVWQASEAYTGNITFIAGQPMTVTALWPIDYQGECSLLDPDCEGDDPRLAGTGHSKDGGATGWYRATGGVTPGETFTLAFAIFDMGDSTYDTTAIVDRWQWDCEGCVPNDSQSCGIEPQ